jgi:hypothetical protein
LSGWQRKTWGYVGQAVLVLEYPSRPEFEDEDETPGEHSSIRRGGCNSGNALLLGLTRLFCKQQRSSTSTNAERQTPNAKREFPPGLKAWAVLLDHFMASTG